MRILVMPKLKLAHIHPEIYGNFSEHLGRCIYGGVYVGENSPIPQRERHAHRRGGGLAPHPPERFAAGRGGCFADEYHWKDGVGPKAARKTHGEHQLGRRDGGQFLWHARIFGAVPPNRLQAYINGNLGSGTVQEMSEWVEYLTNPGVSPMADWRRQNGREAPGKSPISAWATKTGAAAAT